MLFKNRKKLKKDTEGLKNLLKYLVQVFKLKLLIGTKQIFR